MLVESVAQSCTYVSTPRRRCYSSACTASPTPCQGHIPCCLGSGLPALDAPAPPRLLAHLQASNRVS